MRAFFSFSSDCELTNFNSGRASSKKWRESIRLADDDRKIGAVLGELPVKSDVARLAIALPLPDISSDLSDPQILQWVREHCPKALEEEKEEEEEKGPELSFISFARRAGKFAAHASERSVTN